MYTIQITQVVKKDLEEKTNWGNLPIEDISNILGTNSIFSQRFPNVKVPTKIPINHILALSMLRIFSFLQ